MSVVDFSWLVVRVAVGLWLCIFGVIGLRLFLAVLFYRLPRRLVREQQAEIERLENELKAFLPNATGEPEGDNGNER